MEARRRFAIALSFAGEQRAKTVEPVAQALARQFTRERVLYDHFHKEEFARPNLNVHLPNLYRSESELVVVVLSPDYPKKKWCGLELRFIRELIENQPNRVMLLAMGDPGDLSHLGILSGDGYLPIDDMTPEDIAASIVRRHRQETGMTDASISQPAEKQQADDPSFDHSPTCQAMWLAWSENDFEAWNGLLANGFIGSLERVVKRAHPGAELERTAIGFYRLTTQPAISAFRLLGHMRVALAGMQQSAPGALRQLTPRVRDAVLAMCQVLVERRINEAIPRPDRLEDQLPSGLPLAVDTALNAYLIAAAWLGYDIRLEIKDGKVHAEGCLDEFPPNEYGFSDGVNQVREKILSLDEAWKSYQPTEPGGAKPSLGDEYIRDTLIPELKAKRVEVILAVKVDDGKHPLSRLDVREHCHANFGVVTACFGRSQDGDNQLDTWANELQLMILNMHNYLNPVPQEKRPEKAPGVPDSVAFDLLLKAFLALARETPALQAQPETLRTLEAQAKEVGEAVIAPEPHKSNRLKAALDGMEMATKGLDNGAKLLEKLGSVKDLLISSWDSLAQLYK